MILKNKNGESVYFEYMLKITLDDKELILATNENIPNRVVDAIITIPSGISKGIDIVECTGSVGAITLEVYNIDCNFSKILAQYERGAGFYFRKAELFLVKNTGESLLATGLLRSIKPKDYMETMYTLEIADFMSELMKKPTLLFKSKTTYANWFNTTLSNKPANTAYVTVTKYLNLDEDIEIKLKGHPLEVAKFLINNMYKENIAFNTISFDTAKLDTYVTILNKCEFIFTEYIDDTMEYLTENIFRICNVYPYLNKAGELCITRQKQLNVLQDLTIYTIEKSDILSIQPKTMDFTKVVNHLITVRGETEIKDYFFDGNSYEDFKKFIPEDPDEIIINRGTMTDDEVVIIGNDIALNLFVMFASTYQEFTMELELTEFDSLELGDILLITHDKIIDSETGERGITETYIDNYLYCRLDLDSWGDYIPSYEGSVYYSSDFTTEKSYNVDKIVKNSWYDAVIEANINNDSRITFLRG